jgi:hypothetical protein
VRDHHHFHRPTPLLAALLLSALAAAAIPARAATVAEPREPVHGHVIDAGSRQPVAGAVVTLDRESAETDAAGTFELPWSPGALHVRAVGFRRESITPSDGRPIEIGLVPFRPKALYLSFYGIGTGPLRERALQLVQRTELNALVIDVKSDYGKIPYRSDVPLAVAVGAQGPLTIPDPAALVADLKSRGMYLIARIVVFKDVPLATARPDLAVRTASGAVWRDRERLTWTDPFSREVRDYNVDIAVEAARLGFDEIQFDYLRFPDAVGLAYAQPSTRQSRIAAIGELLQEARRRLVPYGVFLSIDVFGYVCWNRDDTMIGQRLEDLAPLVDYVSPMLYPSSFQFGIPGYRNPVAYPYEIVRRSLERARARTGLPAVRFRPWLQAFKDYAFDRRPFDADEIRIQIQAAEQFGSDGWMLWNPRNDYSAVGLVE